MKANEDLNKRSLTQASGALFAAALAAGISEESQQEAVYAFALQCLEEILHKESEEQASYSLL